MSRLRSEGGFALATTVVLMAIMLIMGLALLSLVDTQSEQVRDERVGQSAFNLAEAALSAESLLLGRSWPQSIAATPGQSDTRCGDHTLTGDLSDPGPTEVSLRDQVQDVLHQTYEDGDIAADARWWVTACRYTGTDSWNNSHLEQMAYDDAAGTGPRRMWVRAQGRVDGRMRAVAGLVQANQQPAFPGGYGVVTGTLGAEVGNALSEVTSGDLADVLLDTQPLIEGKTGLRCSVLDTDDGDLCLSGVFTATSELGLGSLLQNSQYVRYRSGSVLTEEQVSQLRQQAQTSGQYYESWTEAACPAMSDPDQVVFIDEIQTTSGSCTLDTAGSKARAFVVEHGRVVVSGGVDFEGVLYALHRTRRGDNQANVILRQGARVKGGVYVDDYTDPATGEVTRGKVLVKPPLPPVVTRPLKTALTAILEDNCTGILGCLLSTITNLVNDLLTDQERILEEVSLQDLTAELFGDTRLPAITYDEDIVNAASTFGDSALVSGTFRQVQPLCLRDNPTQAAACEEPAPPPAS